MTGSASQESVTLDFDLPDALLASAPPEHSGGTRDGVRMLVARTPQDIEHRLATDLPAVLRPGDLLVLNTSDTLPASLRGVTATGERVEVHLSTPDPAAVRGYGPALRARRSRWAVEVRSPTGPFEPNGPGGPTGPNGRDGLDGLDGPTGLDLAGAHRPGRDGGKDGWTSAPTQQDRAGTVIRLAGGTLRLDESYPVAGDPRSRLWSGELDTPEPLLHWLVRHGQPIRYPYTAGPWPLSAYRTGYADTPGSAELPSAGRALTDRVLRGLAASGVRVARVVLHCGVASPEAHEPPYAEWYSVPPAAADAVAAARREGRRVIAVGTTVVRALESTGGASGRGWTDLLVTSQRPPTVVDGVLTGWHEPRGSHLMMLRAFAGYDLLAESYRVALAEGYRWHEFGDLHLILPEFRPGAGHNGG